MLPLKHKKLPWLNVKLVILKQLKLSIFNPKNKNFKIVQNSSTINTNQLRFFYWLPEYPRKAAGPLLGLVLLVLALLVLLELLVISDFERTLLCFLERDWCAVAAGFWFFDRHIPVGHSSPNAQRPSHIDRLCKSSS